MSTSKGFTLIELVVVIVILGILSVTAAPKFLNFTSDAKKATISGFKGVISSQLSMLNAVATIEGKLGNNVTVNTDYGLFQFYRGYPEPKSESTDPNKFFVQTFIDLGQTDSETATNDQRTAVHGDINVFENNDYSRIGYGSGDLVAGKCYVEYFHSSSTESLKTVTDGC
ncbi:type II secretion system protein [Parasalinivibrio latis]|uniref:type II secretion system protein n=1 Tax=Parasalinivibrio latis TaxID=2952610 RepID=UPI003DA457D0